MRCTKFIYKMTFHFVSEKRKKKHNSEMWSEYFVRDINKKNENEQN
jgi:hypothetical protein